MKRARAKKGSAKLLNAWAFYDWANSVYTLTISSSIFPIFYSSLFLSNDQLVNAFGFEMKQTVLITLVTGFAFLCVAILSPILSGIADFVGNKINFLKFFCYLGSAGCIGLYWFSLQHIQLSMFFYFIGLLGYWCSLVFYNSYLPDIAFKNQQDAISAKGFSLGYFGSVLLLILNLLMVMFPEFFGFYIGNSPESYAQAKIEAMRVSFITVGLWWIFFSQYTFAVLPKGNGEARKVTKKVIINGFKELKLVGTQLRNNLWLKRYLWAFFVFSMAVQTIMLVAVYFGEKEILWVDDNEKTLGLIGSILIIQIVAILGAVLTSKASYVFGNIKTLIGINIIWMCLCLYAYFMRTPMQFYLCAGFVGLVMGGIQALARSTYSKKLPKTKDTTSYFSFYEFTEKIGIVIGMFIFSVIDQMSTMRNAILFLFVFFLLGVVLLLRVPKK